jgi:hypothetical protein
MRKGKSLTEIIINESAGIQRENLIGTDFSIYFTEPERETSLYSSI